MRRKVFLLIFTLLLAFTGQRSYSANMTDYCYIPPVVGGQVKPNLLIVMDFSVSMQFPAYVPCNLSTGPGSGSVANCGTSTADSSSPWRYKTAETYYGYFDPNKCYSYSGSNFEESSCNCSDKIGNSNCISGNLLNWITTTRVDIARWVLTGGRTTSSGGNTFLESEGAKYTIQDSNLKCEFKIDASTTKNRNLTISNYGGTCPLGNRAINNANIKIRPPDPNSIKGIIHSFCDTSDLNGQINEKCQLIMEFMVFGGNNRKGVIRVGKDATISNLISGINNEPPNGEKLTGEALWEAYDYYKQSNDHTYESNSAYINRGNAEKDPYYDGSGGNSRPVPCRKGFVLLISDGAWKGSVDPVVPARTMATQDLRDDLSGRQNVYTYAVYAFGDADRTTALQGRQAMITTAIFGGFDDKDSNTWPYPFTSYPSDSRNVVYPLPECNPSGTWNSQCAEWDTAFSSPRDGFPYNFYEADDAPTLRSALISALTDILRRASSGATVATLTSRTGISSLIVQPYYYPKYLRSDNTEVSWLGFLKAFWIDTMQNLREDTTKDKVLNIAGTIFDKIFQFFFDSNDNETKVAILQGSDTTTSCVREGTKSINEVIPVFDAGCQLAYRDPADRTIFYNNNGTLTSFTTSESSYLSNIWKVCSNDPTVLCGNSGDCSGGTCQPADASCIIRYLRGEDLSSDSSCPDYVKRTREVDIANFCPGASGERTWRIGDIINSTPSVVSSEPVNIYHLRYNDATYLDYIRTDAYKNRTSFVFVGANDGMLHAFRVGRLDQTGDPNNPTKVVNAYNDTTSNDLVGREEWAFIPKNALPYLVWYGNPSYCRVPTVDYRTVIFDASIGGPATADKTVSSWRTILIGTMGFGGKSITTSAGTFSSSVFALDLTDWLNCTSTHLDCTSTPPKLLWEFRLPDGTLTTSYPALVRLGDPNKNGEWYVVIGSGPMDPKGTSFVNQPKLYFIDLRTGNIVRSVNIPATGGVSFAVGDIAVVDVDNDYQDDVIYFGAYGTKAGNVWGNFYRLSLRSGTGYKSVSALTSSDICTAIDLSTFASAGNTPPVFGAPNFTKDELGRLWVFFGTGRYIMDSSDKAISYDNYLIGFKDENWNSSTCPTAYTRAQLTDVTNQSLTITITEVKQLCMCDASGCGMKDVVYSAYSNSIPTEPDRGWYYKLTGEAIYSQALVIGGIVDALTYVPPQNICQMEGSSNLISVYYKTGRPYPRPSVLSPNAVSMDGGSFKLLQKISVGQGIPPIGNPFQALQSSQASQQLEKFAQVSSGVVLRITQQRAITSEERFLLWIEK
jgi:type IV pilus assembly protein PilY1